MPRLMANERWQHRSDAFEDTLDIDINGLIPFIRFQCREWRIWHDASVQENNMDASKCFLGKLDDRSVIRWINYIHHLIDCLSASFLNFINQLFQLVLASCAQHDFSAFACQQFCSCLTNS